MNSFAVVDVETTGFTKSDRIVEIAIVHVEGGKITREWETLVNPNRDISNTYIHGISADIVSLAPMFEEIADEVCFLLNERVFAAHNINFDARMLKQEFARSGRKIDLGSGLCTLQETRMKLSAACVYFEVENPSAHRALADARATAEILMKLSLGMGSFLGVKSDLEMLAKPARTLSRDAFQWQNTFSARQRDIPDFNTTGFVGAQLSYLDALSYVMSDLVITAEEAEYLRQWGDMLGISILEREEVHREYLELLMTAARRDGVISGSEVLLIKKTCESLRIPEPQLPNVRVAQGEILVPGNRVCFTGEYRNIDGIVVARKVLEDLSQASGLAPVGSVTKKYCDIVIAADVATMSGKAKKARDLGLRVIGVNEFLKWVEINNT